MLVQQRATAALLWSQFTAATFDAALPELLKFLVAQKGKYFAVEYEKVDEEYLKWWESHGGKEKPFVTN